MLLRYVTKVSKVLLTVAIGAMATVVMLQVLTRYVLKIPFFWTEELARYLMIWAGVLGAALGVSQGVHTSIQWFVSFFPGNAQALISLLVKTLVLCFAVLTLLGSLTLMQFLKFQISPAMRISMIYPFLAFPVGCTVMIAVITSDLLDSAKKFLQAKQ